jgi:hypothetical protein
VILVERWLPTSWRNGRHVSDRYEEKNVEGIKAALVSFDLDFTLFRGIGSWKGRGEQRVAVELDRISRATAEMVARNQ